MLLMQRLGHNNNLTRATCQNQNCQGLTPKQIMFWVKGEGATMKGKSPVKPSKTLVKDRVQYAPNYDAKKQTGMESAMTKVGKKTKR